MMRPESINHYLTSANNIKIERFLKSVDKKEFEQFCKEYIFDVIKGEPFGVAFCNRFKIIDYILMYAYKADFEKAKQHIIKTGYLNDSRSNG